MNMILAVAAGGALGALGRYFLVIQVGHLLGTGFPYGTLAANVIGSFAMGALIETMALVWSTSLEMRAFLTVGVLGAFTTFSTFSMDVALLSERGAFGPAFLYILASVVLSIGALFAAMHLFRTLLS